MPRLLFAILVALSLLMPACCGQQYIEHTPTKPATQQTVKWQGYSETALVISTTMERPVLLYFTLKDCPACELMETETFVDPEVAYYINENFVPIKINATQEDVVDKYGIDRFPTIIVLSSLDNSEIDKFVGASDGQDLLKQLTIVKNLDTVNQLNKVLEDLL